MAPSDATVALRSLPRRFRRTTRPIAEDEELRALLERPGVAGRSVLDLVVDATRSLSMLERALERVLMEGDPVLHPAVLRRTEREFDIGRHGSLEEVLAELEDVATRFADRVTRVAADDWSRSAQLAGGGSLRALDVVREAVATGIDDLREAESTLRELRARSGRTDR